MSARTFYENRSRLDDHLLMASANWMAAKLEGEGQPGDLGPDMWRAIEKQESKWSRSLKVSLLQRTCCLALVQTDPLPRTLRCLDLLCRASIAQFSCLRRRTILL